MSSETIYTFIDRTPYTYFIRWNELDLNYYGRRTARGCHPEEFFVDYFTSSKLVADVIAEYGMPDNIIIHRIFHDVESCKIQEEKFLNRVNASKDPRWLNKTNGDRAWDTTGVTPIKYNNTQEKTKTTNRVRYGVDCVFQHEPIKQKIANTIMEKYGVYNVSQSDVVKEQKLSTCMKNHGVSTYFNTPECRKLTQMGIIKVYGAKTYWESDAGKQYNSTERKKENSLKFYCPHCGRIIGGLANFKGYHGDRCKKKNSAETY